MSVLNSSVSLTTSLPSTQGYTLDTVVASGATAEFSQDQKFKLQATSSSYYDVSTHQYVTTYGLALTNTTTSSSVTLASGSGSSYGYTSLSNFTIADDTFYVASYLKGANQVAFRVFDDTGATVIAETVVDGGTKIDGIYFDGAGALVLAYNSNTEFASLAFSDPDGPVANADTATMKQDAELTVNVLANDTDPTSDKLSLISAEVVSGSADVAVVKGKLTMDYTGAELWLDETAQVQIHYAVSDGTHESTGVLTVDVTDPFNRITGNEGNEKINGTTGRDYVLAGAGNDLIQGKGGSDVICGEAGLDRLFGDGGNDILIGGAGIANLYGDDGNDILVDGDVNDLAVGGAGNDIFIGGAGPDVYWGDAGRDIFYDGAGADLYYGEGGADTFYFFLGGGKGDKIFEFEADDKVRIDSDAAVGMQIIRNSQAADWRTYTVTIDLADGSDVIMEFVDKKDAKGSDWYEVGDYSVPTDSHGLY